MYAKAVKAYQPALLVLIALSASPAGAKVTFYEYDGPEIVKTGPGGVKIVKNGIEYWTDGAPARAYRIIGTITDSRDASDGSAIGSKAVAKKVKQAGGDAVVMISQQVSDAGLFQTGGAGYAVAVPLQNASTSLAVIKYVIK